MKYSVSTNKSPLKFEDIDVGDPFVLLTKRDGVWQFDNSTVYIKAFDATRRVTFSINLSTGETPKNPMFRGDGIALVKCLGFEIAGG